MMRRSNNIFFDIVRFVFIIIVLSMFVFGLYKHFNKKTQKETFSDDVTMSIMDLKEFKTINSDVKDFYNKVVVDEIFPYFLDKVTKVINNTTEINLNSWMKSISSNQDGLKSVIDFLKLKIDKIIPNGQTLPITWLEVIVNSLPNDPDLQKTTLNKVSDDIVSKVVNNMKYVLPTNMHSYDFEKL